MYKVIREESNGVPMTTRDYEMEGPELEVFYITDNNDEPLYISMDDVHYWTSREDAQRFADKLNG